MKTLSSADFLEVSVNAKNSVIAMLHKIGDGEIKIVTCIHTSRRSGFCFSQSNDFGRAVQN